MGRRLCPRQRAWQSHSFGGVLTTDLSLTDRIRAQARCLGFFKTGVVAAGPLPWQESFDSWLAHGMHGEMEYLVRQSGKRRNPSLILEDVRSILILAMHYLSPGEFKDKPGSARISRYAWGDDYHGLMTARLRELLAFIQRAEPGARGICYADSGPVMEKSWAARTTLGWMGKHTNLISREQGSWFFLGAMLLNCELEYDAPEKDYCGSCTRCISACPTGAIIRPYTVDARLCVSYLTIELKGAIPRRLRPLIGNRIFGCDDCQEVCPWNRFAIPSGEQAFQPHAGNLSPDLTALAAITAEEFNARFSNSPIRRSKRNGFVRNVVVALGNSHRSEVVPALIRALGDSSALVRSHAAWALGEIPAQDARAALLSAREVETDLQVLEEIECAINRWDNSRQASPSATKPASAFEV